MTDASLMSEPLDSRASRATGGLGLDSRARSSRWRALIDPASYVPTLIGVAVAAIGFALIGIAWAKVAGLTQVWQQMPYLLSAGLPGLGLVMTGLVVINVSARRQDGAARARQMETLTEALQELQRSLK
jgi:hypothetical protein